MSKPTVVMIGGGQLARMTQQAAVDLDVDLVVLAGSPSEPAPAAGAGLVVGSHDSLDDLRAAAKAGSVVTFDHELVPQAHLHALEAEGVVLRPSPAALRYAQDKLYARSRFMEAGLPVPAFQPVHGVAQVEAFAAETHWPVVLKARSGGYDGRGVLALASVEEIPEDLDWGPAEDPAWLAEEHVSLAAELSVVTARRPGGQSVTYPVVQTTQVEGICTELICPPQVGSEVIASAARLGAEALDLVGAVGICAVEMFVDARGRVLINEVALRPHNSGHATIEANGTSQFHNHLRAVLDWPLGATDLLGPAVAMVNLIGRAECPDPYVNRARALGAGRGNIHLYGKASRPGRKIGHVTSLASDVPAALADARAVAGALLAPPESPAEHPLSQQKGQS